MGLDASQFLAAIAAKGQAAISAAISGVDQAGEHTLGVAQQLAPVGGGSHSPYDPAPGTLQASATAEPAELQGNVIVKRIGFNTAYAAVQHENLDLGHDIGQAKYLESAMSQTALTSGEFVAGKVKAAVEG